MVGAMMADCNTVFHNRVKRLPAVFFAVAAWNISSASPPGPHYMPYMPRLGIPDLIDKVLEAVWRDSGGPGWNP